MSALAYEIGKLLCGSASITTGIFGLWAILQGEIKPLGLVIAIPAIACGLYTAASKPA